MNNPTAFISYSWDDEAHKSWMIEFAARLRADGINVEIDQWNTVPGDQLPEFMERAIRTNEYVFIVCTPNYKVRSESRAGGVGYEGDIMTAEIHTTRNNKKFIPLLRRGDWHQAAPTWLSGKYYIDFRGDPFKEKSYEDLLTTVYGSRPTAPPLGTIPKRFSSPVDAPVSGEVKTDPESEIRIKGIIADEVSTPTLDGTRGSALYRVPFQLTRVPSGEWSSLFVQTWDHPPSFTGMHRPGTATVEGDRIFLNRTTIEEVEKYHRDTLLLVVNEVNRAIASLELLRSQGEKRRSQAVEEHHKNVTDTAKKIKFD